ncbi:ABC transporter permease [Paenibacillus azoreducens]|uniref:Peptide ABC transporter permease n=1 Tax=Paenibacillus azoreducens TaxID=116718 RepID=A0A919YBY1_9BACL|nr:ABC transporter permease [Paenibacillus azoreducens]GIO47896.1 peptide ABC transporter permease [Paenibacillus azoreducens]
MWKYILNRTLQSIVVLLIVSSVAFSLMHLMPGNPWTRFGMTEQQLQAVEEMKQLHGFDLPIYQQYIRWLAGLSQGYLGLSYDFVPIDSFIWDFARNSLILLGTAWLISLMIAIPWGIHNSLKPGGVSDRLATLLGLIGFSIPAFVLGYWLQQLFAMRLLWLPPSSMHTPSKAGDIFDLIQHMVLPVATLTLGMLAYYLKFIRNGMLEVLESPYLITARAKGASERRVIYRHALKNTLIPIITLIAIDIPALIGGSAVVENVFHWEGLGFLMLTSALQRDLPVLIAIILILSIFIIAANWLADVLYTLVDPRVRLTGKKRS